MGLILYLDWDNADKELIKDLPFILIFQINTCALTALDLLSPIVASVNGVTKGGRGYIALGSTP